MPIEENPSSRKILDQRGFMQLLQNLPDDVHDLAIRGASIIDEGIDSHYRAGLLLDVLDQLESRCREIAGDLDLPDPRNTLKEVLEALGGSLVHLDGDALLGNRKSEFAYVFERIIELLDEFELTREPVGESAGYIQEWNRRRIQKSMDSDNAGGVAQ